MIWRKRYLASEARGAGARGRAGRRALVDLGNIGSTRRGLAVLAARLRVDQSFHRIDNRVRDNRDAGECREDFGTCQKSKGKHIRVRLVSR